jgi:hypothetical protein
MACLLGKNDYTAYSLFHPPTWRFVRAKLAWSVGGYRQEIGMLWAPTNMAVCQYVRYCTGSLVSRFCA